MEMKRRLFPPIHRELVGHAFLITASSRLHPAQHIWKSCSGVCVTPLTILPGLSESLLELGSLGADMYTVERMASAAVAWLEGGRGGPHGPLPRNQDIATFCALRTNVRFA
ncbi:unnamed protein product [Rangifer tarandus platyrhynchus]|uniref:Uncharacterized protein n=1 Tax=Rangifer tarandus platyrhynchus TaxID=3082113 RepID=A0AC59Z2U7_RANTA